MRHSLVPCLLTSHTLTQDRTHLFVPLLQNSHHSHDNQRSSSSKSQSSRHLIINGRTAVRGRYPYFCTLDHYGGGALIAPDIILTAGHVKPGRRSDVQPRVGMYSFKHLHHNDDDDDSVEGDGDAVKDDFEQFPIQEMVRHPDFVYVGDDEFIHDFTILKLQGQSTKQPVRINRHAHVPAIGQAVTAMGVGNTSPDYESKSSVLKEVVLHAIANDVCEKSESDSNSGREDESYKGRIFPSMMCTTGGPHNERDAWYVTLFCAHAACCT
jgi:hypothetical protein